MDEDEEEFEYFGTETISRRFLKADLLVLGLDLVSGMARAVADTLTCARDTAAMHANWCVRREAFREEAALEIESMTNGDSE